MPYILALVRLDGANTLFLHVPRGVPPDRVMLGQQVRVAHATPPVDQPLHLIWFEPAESGGIAHPANVCPDVTLPPAADREGAGMFSSTKGKQMMTLAEVLAELESLGTEQNRKIYRRHGAGDNLYGVSFANLNKIAKRMKRNTPLARELWDTGNADARALATMIVDPKEFTAADADHWLDGVTYYMLVDLLAGVVTKSPAFVEKMEEWRRSPDEWPAQAGWDLLAAYAMNRDGRYPDVPDAYFEDALATIERTIHGAPNRTRHAMNNAVIGIGMRNDHLAELATAAARRIGKVEVDHGETGCKTPDAADYIAKSRARLAVRPPKTPKQKAAV